jgi:phage baseplate assembly protein V
MVSWWLPICVPKTQDDKAYWLPDVGEQVVCMMDEHDEDGAVLGCIYSQVDTTPVQSADKWHITMKDTATLEYDRNLHQLAVSLPTNATMSLIVNGVTISIDSSRNINLSGASDIKLVTNSHNDSINNIITVFNEHTHGGVQAGSSVTAVPNQQLT